jgi:PPOX class probable F420-dependent enzyme
VDLTAARTFLEDHHRAVLVTTRGDGRPQLSPVVVGLDDDGAACVSTREPAMKVRNVRRRPAVSLCVLDDAFTGPWIQVDGTAEVVELPEAMERLVDLYRRIRGEHPDWDEFRAAMARERRVVLRIRLEAAGPDRSG